MQFRFPRSSPCMSADEGIPYWGERGLCFGMRLAEHEYMGQPQRIHTYDDDLHERRRHLAIIREPIDFEAERLKRLVDKARDTRDP